VIKELGRTRVYVDHLRVDPPVRRRGVASELLEAVERWGREHGAAMIALDTYVDSPVSVQFYEAVGYRRTSIVFGKPIEP
jgi:GNAT superfamily N-acetyltransferase